MVRFEALTSWVKHTSDGEELDYPEIYVDHLQNSSGHSFVDATGQARSILFDNPNLFVVECICDDTTFANIEVDNKYLVLWSESI